MLLGKFVPILKDFDRRRKSRLETFRRKIWQVLEGWNIRVAREGERSRSKMTPI